LGSSFEERFDFIFQFDQEINSLNGHGQHLSLVQDYFSVQRIATNWSERFALNYVNCIWFVWWLWILI